MGSTRATVGFSIWFPEGFSKGSSRVYCLSPLSDVYKGLDSVSLGFSMDFGSRVGIGFAQGGVSSLG